MKKTIVFLLVIIFSMTFLLGCEQKKVYYKEGTYIEVSDKYSEEYGLESGYGVVALTIKDNRFTLVEFTICALDGTIKDEAYGFGLTQTEKEKLNVILQARKTYCKKFVEHQGFSGWDPIKGATIIYAQFKDALDKLIPTLILEEDQIRDKNDEIKDPIEGEEDEEEEGENKEND